MVKQDVFLKAGIITVILLIISLMVGEYVESTTYSRINNDLIKINENQEAIMLLQSFTDENNSERMCNIIENQIDSINGKIYFLRSELELQKSTSILKNYDAIRREYFLANARLLSLTKQYVKKCGGNEEIVLFFYTSEKECPECYVQGRIIDEVRGKCKNLRVFSFPTDVDMSIIKSFMAYYGVVDSPSVVIDKKGGYVVLNCPVNKDVLISKINCTE